MTDPRLPDKWSDGYDPNEPFDEGYDDDSLELVPCPKCGEEIYEEAEQCPACGSYVIHQSNAWTGRPTWWLVLGLLGIVMTVLALALYF